MVNSKHVCDVSYFYNWYDRLENINVWVLRKKDTVQGDEQGTPADPLTDGEN